jgi:hypothetical protein
MNEAQEGVPLEEMKIDPTMRLFKRRSVIIKGKVNEDTFFQKVELRPSKSSQAESKVKLSGTISQQMTKQIRDEYFSNAEGNTFSVGESKTRLHKAASVAKFSTLPPSTSGKSTPMVAMVTVYCSSCCKRCSK